MPKTLTNGATLVHEAPLTQLDARALLITLKTVRKGDFSARMSLHRGGIAGEIAETLNDIIEANDMMAREFARISQVVGKEGKLTTRAYIGARSGSWATCVDSVNSLIGDLVQPTTEVASVIGAVARGDLSRTMPLEIEGRPLKGAFLQIASTVNTMVGQLGSFASEVTRVAREVGTEGKLGGQAVVKGVAGVWEDLTDNVNSMASNLTSQVRNIAKVVSSVANGNLKQKLALEARGEIAALADTINAMIDTLAVFADQVTGVAREVGVEGKLGGQARVPGATGIWRDLTDNVNQLAANLTTQVRSIADVSTAVTKGDLTQSITVQAQGEVASLKDNINEMIRNLRQTTRKNADQDWLKTNLAKFTRMLQGQRDLDTVSRQILSELAPLVGAQQGLFYVLDARSGQDKPLKLLGSYAVQDDPDVPRELALGEGLVGQCSLEKQKILAAGAPEDYIRINSGLGSAKPLTIAVLPALFEGQVKGVLELASFDRFSEIHLNFLEQLTESIGIVLNTIAATMRTEDLLTKSQSLANELQQTNAQLEEKARLLSEQKKEVEGKNREIEVARQAIEEKAEQLTLTSKYKSQFLANMSHELRTPLNSLLILARNLAENPEKNLSEKQVEFARTINASGKDLLALINDILDLSKIESGTISLEIGEVGFKDLRDYVERGFHQIAEEKGLAFSVSLDPELPETLLTDSKRLQQVLRNLLSNALKFTEHGTVSLQMGLAAGGWSSDAEALNKAERVLAFSVSDSGIGIPVDKQRIIFEAFQQVDMTTSRKYGGTGLGLSISREIATMLGGELRVESAPGAGSTFTLYLPASYVPPKPRPVPGAAPVLAERTANDSSDEAERDGQEPLALLSREVEDDRAAITPEDWILLVIEDDPVFAGLVRDAARAAGYKVLAAAAGLPGLALAQKYLPHAITLDAGLPDVDGWAVFDRLKHDPRTRHIPVQVLSGQDQRERAMSQGAFSYLLKPVPAEALEDSFKRLKAYGERGVKRLLLVEDNAAQRSAVQELLACDKLDITPAASGQEALAALRGGGFDCMVLDLRLPDMSGLDLIAELQRDGGLTAPPIIIYTGKELTRREEGELRKAARSVILKDARSPERLLDEVALFAHLEQDHLPETKRHLLAEFHRLQPLLAGKRVLIVDDDVRNIFALTSVLERYQMKVVHAENGKAGLAVLQESPEVDIVLMDVMMPDMDGYETMQHIRKMERFAELPIIALTAKAMKGDREKCIEAGASDYIPKPVEVEQLLSLLRVWLYRGVLSA